VCLWVCLCDVNLRFVVVVVVIGNGLGILGLGLDFAALWCIIIVCGIVHFRGLRV